MRITSRIRGLCRLLLGFCLVTATSFADDTELFVTEGDAPISCPAPNVLFIIDTSGSMDSEVITQQPWDPGLTFDGCYRSDAIYFSGTATIPDCDSTDFILKTAAFCDAFQGIEYTGLFQAWDEGQERWRKLDESDSDWPLECFADEGLHGDGSGDDVYAVDGDDGPWSDEFDDRISWGGNASAATLFDGNRLNWQTNPPEVSSTRIDVVKEVTTAALDSMPGVNVGLMRFNDNEGGPVLHALENIDTASDDIKAKINALPTDGSTPIAETLYEAGQYLAGRAVQFGDEESDNLSVAESRVGGLLSSTTYDSPLDETGQTNYIVLLTDGAPTDDTDADSDIASLPEFNTLIGSGCVGNCLDEMAAYLQQKDLRSDVDGVQNVITHTIGFDIDLDLLRDTATAGGGRYFIADNTASLTQVLADLAQDFNNTVSLLASPGIPIEAFNLTENVDAAYVSLFKPTNTYRWPGNVKRYRLAADFDGEGGVTVRLVDALGNNAIDDETGLFRNSAVSEWSAPEIDGGRIDVGGAGSLLPEISERKLYTDIAGNTLTASGNRIETSNGNLTAALLGAPEEERDLVIEWALGADVRDVDDDPATTNRKSMGDPLHVQPVTITYGATANDAQTVVFVTTNDGYLHAFQADTGEELWAYIPSRLLNRLHALSLDQESPAKQYGLDGPIRVVQDSTKKILVFGMRRGGEALFALDVTNRLAPRKIWEIDSNTSGFEDMGQTWPLPVFGRINNSAVLLLSGGYDPGQDNRTYRTDESGNALYAIRLTDGSLLWSAGNPSGTHDLELPELRFSIPAAPAVRDFDGDGNIDTIYAADMGGQVFRFDLIDGNSGSDLGEGGVLASLGGAAIGSGVSAADTRRFYNTPDVVLTSTEEKLVISVNIGSGYRAHPLDTDNIDEFYSIRDLNGTGTVLTDDYGAPIERDDLLDITNNVDPSIEFNAPGWRLRMAQGPGEKILGDSLTIAGTVFFNSFQPTGTSNTCLPAGGINRLYVISVLTGAPLTNLDQSADPEDLTETDRFVELSQGGIVAAPELVVVSNPDAEEGDADQFTELVCVGTQCVEEDVYSGRQEGKDCVDRFECPRETFWFPGQ